MSFRDANELRCPVCGKIPDWSVIKLKAGVLSRDGMTKHQVREWECCGGTNVLTFSKTRASMDERIHKHGMGYIRKKKA